jgi:hypothetical protein
MLTRSLFADADIGAYVLGEHLTYFSVDCRMDKALGRNISGFGDIEECAH